MEEAQVGGLGPWFCGLYFSLSPKAKKQSELRVHTYPILYQHALNTTKEGEGWVLVMLIGHFEEWSHALQFYKQWIKQTRGKTKRMQRGLALFNAHYRQYNLKMWTQPLTKEEALEKWQQLVVTQKRRQEEPFTIDTVMKIQTKRNKQRK